MTRILAVIVFVALATALGWILLQDRSGAAERPGITVGKGTVVRKAVASGQVDPIQETQVNTQLSGFVRTLHSRLGEKVAAGAPLCEVWPARNVSRSTVNQLPLDQTAKGYLGEPLLSVGAALLIAGVLGVCAGIAGWHPAARAAAVQPVEALRHD